MDTIISHSWQMKVRENWATKRLNNLPKRMQPEVGKPAFKPLMTLYSQEKQLTGA